MAYIVGVGNPVYDSITTPFITTGERVLSGCSTNGCIALARLGHRVAMVGSAGEDYAQQLRVDTQRLGIQLYLQPGGATGGFQLIYDTRGDRTLDLLGIADPITNFPAACAQADALIIGPIMQETPPALIQQIRAVTEAPLFLDPQGLLRRIGPDSRIERYRSDAIDQIAPFCTVIKANELETRIITGLDPHVHGDEAVRRLQALGCTIAIVTLAEAGSLIYADQRVYHIPAYKTIAGDPTGAGDTYMAGFIDAYLQHPENLFAAGCRAAACASIWIEHTGPDAPISVSEVARRSEVLLEQARQSGC